MCIKTSGNPLRLIECSWHERHCRWSSSKSLAACLMHCAVPWASYSVGTLLLNLAFLEGKVWCLPRWLEVCEWSCTLHLRFARMSQAWKKRSPNQNINQPVFYWKWNVEIIFECFPKGMFPTLHRKQPHPPSFLLTGMVTTKKILRWQVW